MVNGCSREGSKKRPFDYLVIFFQDHNDPFKMNRILNEKIPNYIVMYDCELEFVRQVEVKCFLNVSSLDFF